MVNMETVSFELIDRIRHHINETTRQAALLKNVGQWLQLTAALDVLEDSSWAVQYYLETDYPIDVKGKYLFTYGLLQALFLQQDAIFSINKALFGTDIDLKVQYPTAYATRELRNDVVGHPTWRDGGKHFVYLAQISLCKKSFYYIKQSGIDGNVESITVDIEGAVSDTAKAINRILTHALEELDSEFCAYINAHKERKMKEIFNLLGYVREKTLLKDTMRSWGYDSTKEMVQKCEEELVLRYGSIDVVDSYAFLLEDIHNIFDLIDNGLPRIPADLVQNSEKYLLEILFAKLEELKQYCEETDEYFANGGEIDYPKPTMAIPIIDDIPNGSDKKSSS